MASLVERLRWILYRMVHPDRDRAVRLARKDIKRMAARIEALEVEQRVARAREHDLQRTVAQVRLATALNLRQQDVLARLTDILDRDRIAAHVQDAIAGATLCSEPYEHMVVEPLLPAPVYDLLLEALPPEPFFKYRDPIKQTLKFPMEVGPALSIAVWEYVDQVLARRVIRPAVLSRFESPLRRHFGELFGETSVERAAALPQSVHGGRLMLSRPGYHLAPHRDPKYVMLTCLLYLQRAGDDERYGTQVFRVRGDREAFYKQTFYPEQAGDTCELVKVIPFRRNSMLVFLNSRGAHGATIPPDAPADFERYTYQFYVAPDASALRALIKSLAPAKRALWRNKAGTAATA